MCRVWCLEVQPSCKKVITFFHRCRGKDEQQETYIIPGAGGMCESVEMNHTDGPDDETPISSAKKK